VIPRKVDPCGPALNGSEGVAPTPRPGLFSVVTSLTAVLVLTRLMGFITGPIIARALGPVGRGDLAAVLVPLSIAPWLVEIGLPDFASRSAARGRSPGLVVGTLGLLTLGLGMLGAAAAWPVAQLFGHGRSVVETYLFIGLLLLPLGTVANLLSAVQTGLERWRRVYTIRLAPFVVNAAVVVALYATDSLTTGSAAIAAIVGGATAVIPSLGLLRDSRPLRFARSLAQEGLAFGAKAWLGVLGNVANLRLDQLLMVFLVPRRELGIYAVAVAVSSASTALTGAVGPALIPRAARADYAETGRALRLTIGALVSIGLVLGLLAPVLVPALFGASFRDAVPVVWILLAAAVPGQAASVLLMSLIASGRAAAGAVSESIALLITVPGLVLLLPVLQAQGAALVSLAAYTASFTYALVVARRQFELRFRQLLIMDARDAASIANAVRTRLPRGR
jgi:O-antigen/teichoic acid export membrane protein